LNTKRIVLSGGPSSGKTTLIDTLSNQDFVVFEEISRSIIKSAQLNGVLQPFLENPIQFNIDVLKGRLKQYINAISKKSPVFYDRGVHDVVAYMNYAQQEIPKEFHDACEKCQYDLIFLLPPWKAIHVQDQERYETFEQAQQVYEAIKATYKKYNFNFIEVPTGTVQERVNFILKHL